MDGNTILRSLIMFGKTMPPHMIHPHLDFTSMTIRKKHIMRKITTRTYYPGKHQIEVLINGISFGLKEFDLVMEKRICG